ncbi:MAG: hypothetical protein AAGH64_03395 [Planctomycetota bacterium]
MSAQPIVYGLTGLITDAENLAFSVINGNPLSQNPQPGDLPLPFTGTLTIDTASGSAQLQFGGAFTSPTRSYVFDVTTPNIIGGLDTPAFGTPIVFSDAFDAFDFELAFPQGTGPGSFTFLDPGAVPTSPPQDVSVEASITGVEVLQVPTPGASLIALSAVALGARRRRT